MKTKSIFFIPGPVVFACLLCALLKPDIVLIGVLQGDDLAQMDGECRELEPVAAITISATTTLTKKPAGQNIAVRSAAHLNAIVCLFLKCTSGCFS